jgi:predicted ATPase
MGVVFRGFDVATKQPVAIKVLKATQLSKNPADLERFRREGEALAALRHPNVVEILDRFEEGEGHYIVMELVEAGSLAGLTAELVSLPVSRVLALALELTDALARAHQLGIVHRDIKPGNVLIASDGTARLSDFGVALMTDRRRLSGSDALIGTLEYLSPEVLLGRDADARADLWALGVLLFELLAGRPPFTGEHAGAILHSILNAAPPELERLRPDCPLALVDLVYRLLAKERSERIPSARHVGIELAGVIASKTAPSGGTPAVAPTSAFGQTIAAADVAQTPYALPTPLTPFIGREAELAGLARLLLDPTVRLITVVGPGGMGKSRLVLEAARLYLREEGAFAATKRNWPRSAPGVCCVELAPLVNPELVLSAIADASGLKFRPGSEPKEQLFAHLRSKISLLILDNFEHVIQAANLVAELLAAAPSLSVLVTSRQRLGLSCESVFQLAGLGFPTADSTATTRESSGVRLFVSSARRVRGDLELTDEVAGHAARVCALVQGSPLGIVLAASWTSVLTVDEIALEIERSFEFLAAELEDIPARHRSLNRVFDYSYDLLTPEERVVAARLSVFRGGFTRAAAEHVAGATLKTLAALANKSLLVRDPASGRYSMHELLRQYAALRLGLLPDEVERSAREHAAYFTTFLCRQAPLLKRREGLAAARNIEMELGNLQAAWPHLLKTQPPAQLGEVVATFGLFRELHALANAEALFRTAVACLSAPEPAPGTPQALVLGRVLAQLAQVCVDEWRNEEAVVLATQATAWLDEEAHPLDTGRALLASTLSLLWLGKVEEGVHTGERALSLFEVAGDTWELARALRLFGRNVAWLAPARSEACLRRSIELQRSLALGAWALAEGLSDLGGMLAEQGAYGEGCALMLEGLGALEAQDNSYGKLSCLQSLASAERKWGCYDAAEAHGREVLALARASFPFAEASSQVVLASVLKERGSFDEAVFHLRAAMSGGDETAAAIATVDLGDMALQRGEPDTAAAMFQRGLAQFERLGTTWGVIVSLDYLGHLACARGRHDEARKLFQRALSAALASRSLPLALNVVAGIAQCLAAQADPERAVELLVFVSTHPITERQTLTRRVEPLLSELSARVAPAVVAAAEVRAQRRELEPTLAELLAAC